MRDLPMLVNLVLLTCMFPTHALNQLLSSRFQVFIGRIPRDSGPVEMPPVTSSVAAKSSKRWVMDLRNLPRHTAALKTSLVPLQVPFAWRVLEDVWRELNSRLLSRKLVLYHLDPSCTININLFGLAHSPTFWLASFIGDSETSAWWRLPFPEHWLIFACFTDYTKEFRGSIGELHLYWLSSILLQCRHARLPPAVFASRGAATSLRVLTHVYSMH